MRFDTIIIGGGLSAYVAGITLQEKGQKVLVVSAGQSALHFFSGSFGLIATEGSQSEAIAALPAEHPYSKLGVERVMRLAGQAGAFFEGLGYKTTSEQDRNISRATTFGGAKPCWLTIQTPRKSAYNVQFPMSPLGIAIQINFRKHFEQIGGTVLNGDIVNGGEFQGDRLVCIHTENHGEGRFEADNFILATGSFFSGGLVSTQEEILEPVFGLDVDWQGSRDDWFSKDTFDSQPYMKFGVHVDENLRTYRSGKAVSNLYAAGSVIGGASSITQGCGGGVAVVTGFAVAENILGE